MRFAAVLTFVLLAPTASAALENSDIDQAATRTAEALNGVLRNCPASFAKIGTEAKKCVGVGGTVEQVRVKLSSALGSDLYGVWRSKDEQRSVYNWVKTASGYVYLRLQADPDGRAETLVYLDAPPEGSTATSPSGSTGSGSGSASTAAPVTPTTQIGSVTLTPAPSTTTPTPPSTTSGQGNSAPAPTPTPGTPAVAPTPAPQPAPQPPVPSIEIPPVSTPPATGTPAAAEPAPAVTTANLAPVPFTRVLQLQSKRMNGPDVRAVQNRLIALMRPARSGQGDGWFGPVTAGAVRAFQAANNLPVTGQVNRATWDALFSPNAKTYTPTETP